MKATNTPDAALSHALEEWRIAFAADDAAEQFAAAHAATLAARLLAEPRYIQSVINGAALDAAVDAAALCLTDPAQAGVQLASAVKRQAVNDATGLLIEFAHDVLADGDPLDAYNASHVSIRGFL